MNRRDFIKLMAAGATPLAVSVLCKLPLQSIVSSPTATSTFIPTKLPPSATPTIGPVPAPARGLGSNSNYFLHSNCEPITGLSVTIEITKDIISDIGFSFQLNCNSPQGSNTTWQQYIFAFDTHDNSPLKVDPYIDNWATASFVQSKGLPPGNLINHHESILTLPGAMLPAGYKCTIKLLYDQNNNVDGVTFIVVDNTGKSTSTQMMLESLTYAKSSTPVGADALAPIYSFELVLVGSGNDENSYLSQGAGTITYTATSPLFVASKNPLCAIGNGTGEQANSVYAALFEGPSQKVVQTFDSEIPSPYAPGIPFAVSQQFGANQTDLFAIDSKGQLDVFYSAGAGHWHSLQPLGPEGMVHPRSPLAASQRFGVNNRTDVYSVDQNFQLNVFWAEGAGAWNGPEPIGPKKSWFAATPLAVSQHFGVNGRTDIFLFEKDTGQLYVVWAVGSSSWQAEALGPSGLTGYVGIAASQHFGVDNRTDVFMVDKNGQLNTVWAVGPGKWSETQTIGPAGLARSGASVAVSQRFGKKNQTDVYVVDMNGQLNVFSAIGPGDWSARQTIGPSGLTVSGAAIAVAQKPGTTDQTQVFVFDKSGQLNVFTADSSGHWSDAAKIGPQNIAPAGAAIVVSQQFGVQNQTDVFFVDQIGSGSGPNEQGWPSIFWSTDGNQWNGPKELVHDL